MAFARGFKVLSLCFALIACCAAQKGELTSTAAPGDKAGDRLPIFQRGLQSVQVAATTARPMVQVGDPNFRMSTGEEMDGMELTLVKYEVAFESLSLPQVRQIWPALDRQHEAAFKKVFAAFREASWKPRLGLECAIPKVTAETANVDCRETLIYGNSKGKSKDVGPARVAILLRKQSSGWVVGDMKGSE